MSDETDKYRLIPPGKVEQITVFKSPTNKNGTAIYRSDNFTGPRETGGKQTTYQEKLDQAVIDIRKESPSAILTVVDEGLRDLAIIQRREFVPDTLQTGVLSTKQRLVRVLKKFFIK